MKTYIIGHQKPDTDAVVATMAFAHLCQNVPSYSNIQNPTPAITDPLNPETSFLFDKFSIDAPTLISAKDIAEDDQVVLVDHNEESQRLEGLNPDQITAIIDHHKANVNLNAPIYMTFKPWGSTCTVIGHLLLVTHNIEPDKTLASLMLASILSDTVGYKSATTTDKDREIGDKLAKLAGITDVDAFTLEIFKAKSDISKLSDEEIVTNDYKVFDFGGKKVLINQIETVEQDAVLARKADLLKAMESVKAKEGVDLIFCAVSDILKVNTKLICLGSDEAKVAESAFDGRVGESILDIGPALSRKKQIAPPIEKVLTN